MTYAFPAGGSVMAIICKDAKLVNFDNDPIDFVVRRLSYDIWTIENIL